MVLIKNISQCWGDGSHYKLWDSYQFQQDLELEALTWTVRHLQTSASPYHICTYEVLLLNATSILNRKTHELALCKSEFCHSKAQNAGFCLESAICFSFVVVFVRVSVTFFKG